MHILLCLLWPLKVLKKCRKQDLLDSMEVSWGQGKKVGSEKQDWDGIRLSREFEKVQTEWTHEL